MIEVTVDSIRVSLMNQQRIIVLKDMNDDRFLPIWIGQFEAEAITIELQDIPKRRQRPLTHDLLKNTIEELGGQVEYVLVNDMRGDTYYARIVIQLENDDKIEIDARPSDSIALAVRCKAPIFVAQSVMDRAGKRPEDDVEMDEEDDIPLDEDEDLSPMVAQDREPDEDVDESRFSAFADFVNSLDLDELDDDDKN